MDELIDQGFDRLCAQIRETKDAQKEALDAITKENVAFLEKMIRSVTPVIAEIGSEYMLKGKQDQKGDLYDQKFYPDKMIILGKPETPVAMRPDNPTKQVAQQFCVMTEKGELFELMYSNDGFIIDSYLSPLTAEDALAFYGYDIMYMLYSAMREYQLAQEDVLNALNLVLGAIQRTHEKPAEEN